jgi:predicted ATP-dependent endonuclease of OLD family
MEQKQSSGIEIDVDALEKTSSVPTTSAMRIKSIRIENFRSIKKAFITPSNFNVFVGQNNHGKTNLFEAIRWFYNKLSKGEKIEDVRFGRKGNDEILIEICFEGAQNGAERMSHEANKTKIKKLLDGVDEIVIRRSSADETKRTLIVNGKEIANPGTGIDTALNDFLPKFEYVDTRKYFEDVGKYGKTTPIGIMLSGVLTTILETSEEYQKFHAQFEKLFGDSDSDVKVELDRLSERVKFYLEKQFPDCTRVTFEVNPLNIEDLLKNFDTTVDDGVETAASEKGDGMQRALMLSILQAYAEFRKKNEDIGKSFLFFIDEAELHLHPTAQRKLKNVLLELSMNGDQVFLNTHSSVLVVDDHAGQTIFKVEKENRETSFQPISEDDKPYVVYELLGGSPADLLLPKNFLIVEGGSDVVFVSSVIKRFYPDKKGLQVISSNGGLEQISRSLNAIEKIFAPLEKSIYKEKTVILFDKSKDEKLKQSFIDTHPYLRQNSQIYDLGVGSLEEYYPAPWKKDTDQVKKLSSHQKRNLAKEVAEEISKDDFEKKMSIVYSALTSVFNKSF